MSIAILQELALSGSVPNFTRDYVENIADFASTSLARKYPNIYEVYCLEDGCKYKLDKIRHSSDPVLGKWRKVGTQSDSSSGSSSTWSGTSEELETDESSISTGTLIVVTESTPVNITDIL